MNQRHVCYITLFYYPLIVVSEPVSISQVISVDVPTGHVEMYDGVITRICKQIAFADRISGEKPEEKPSAGATDFGDRFSSDQTSHHIVHCQSRNPQTRSTCLRRYPQISLCILSDILSDTFKIFQTLKYVIYSYLVPRAGSCHPGILITFSSYMQVELQVERQGTWQTLHAQEMFGRLEMISVC